MNPAEVRKAKNQQLAMLQLSENGSLAYGTLEVDRSDFLFVCDQLKDERLAQFHLELLQEERLLAFLSFGDTAYFEEYQHQQLWEDPAFRRFIGPFYEEQFDQVYAHSFAQRDVYLLRKMLEPEHLLPPGGIDGLYRMTKRRAEEEKTQLRNYQQGISYSAEHTLPASSSDFALALQSVSSIEVWQALPDAFTPLRSEVALLYSALVNQMQRLYGSHDRVTEELLSAVGQLEVNAQVRRYLEEQHREFFTRKQAEINRQKKEQQQKTADFIKKVDQLLRLFQEGKVGINVLLVGLRELYEGKIFQELEAAFSDYERKQLGRKLRTLSVLLWEKEKDLQFVFELMTIVKQLPAAEKPWYFFPVSEKKQNHQAVEQRTKTAILLLGTLRSLVDKNRRFNNDKEHLAGWISLVDALFSEDVQQWLLRTGSYSLLTWTHQQLFPLLYFLRSVDPMATLRLLHKLHPLLHDDNVISEKTNQLRKAIKEDVHKTKTRPVSPRSERVDSPWAAVQQFFDRLKVQSAGLETLHWIQVGIAGIICMTIVVFGYSYLFVQKQPIPIEIEPPAPPSISEIDFYKQDFIVKKDSFIGNQLDNYALAFPRCFGSGVYGGQGSLVIKNISTADVIACLYLKDSLIVRHAYIQKGDRVLFTELPPDSLGLKFYFGNDWNPLKPNFCSTHGAFDSDFRYWLARKKLPPATLANGALIAIFKEESIMLPDGQIVPFKTAFHSVSAAAYFYIKPDWKRRRDGELEFSNDDDI